jgi:RIO-like serine/threonine protein kinase
MATETFLKRGACGDILTEAGPEHRIVVRDLSTARWAWLARHLARREARALERLAALDGVPRLIALEPAQLRRSFLPGRPMQEAQPRMPAYYREALRLLRQIHARRVAHNDLAKEANWLCLADGNPAILDFQLAICFARRGRWFRLLAREDLRHLMKHKAYYLPDALTARQRRLLQRPSWATRCWRALFKPSYHFVTRRLLGWPERVGAAERQRGSTR